MAELRRRAVHASGVGFPALYLLGLADWTTLRWLLLVGAGVAAGLETIRLWIGLDWAIYETLTREYERDNVAGYALYMFSMAGVALVFDPLVAVPGMLMLTLGDPISGLLGSNEAGRAKRASVIAVMFGVCFALAALVLVPHVPLPPALVAAAVGSAGATVADGFTPVVRGYVLDDNLTIPPVACLGIWLVLRVSA
ncbi:diacylglycerol/polyprenol kinase family protein [Haloplanus aerogenes]|uniref:Dolichol kinase n=1 Tax=Haloplanus aerogenes TaxID=660522 RepID=A0A3M0D0E1_9EURY|nr:dolichol kinase [Haloplanus aerogenes]AZH24094.1 dolichol kinase [Haloplanus aerogenes]RMB13129.1 dolichol kinase [Haloplanus aerogenes]